MFLWEQLNRVAEGCPTTQCPIKKVIIIAFHDDDKFIIMNVCDANGMQYQYNRLRPLSSPPPTSTIQQEEMVTEPLTVSHVCFSLLNYCMHAYVSHSKSMWVICKFFSFYPLSLHNIVFLLRICLPIFSSNLEALIAVYYY